MKTKITSVIIFFCLLLVGSCKKADPIIPPGNSPVFYFNGTINSAPVNLQAGVNNYYMFTSYALDGNGVYDYIGELKNYSCTTNCVSALKVLMKDYRNYSLAPTNIDSAISPGYYSFATPAGTASKFSVLFYDSLYNGVAQSFLYDFGDGATTTQHRPSHLYSRPGVYSVSLNAQSTTSCSSSLTNDVMVGQVRGLVQLSFNEGSTSVTTVTLATTTGGGSPPYSFHWDFGDGNATTVTTPTCTYTYGAPGVYPITLTRTDAANTVEICRRNFATQTATSCYMNFYPTLVTPIANPMNLADVTIEWRDASGNLYTSSNNTQPAKSGFKIISVANYQNNSSGQPTKIIHAKVTCTLYNGTNSMVLDGDVVFSIAHL